jgi:hypothetical protein
MKPKITWTQEPDEGFLATVEDPFDPGGVFHYRYRAAILDPDSPCFIRERGHKERAAIKVAMNEFNRKRAWREYEALPEWLQARSFSQTDDYPEEMRGAAVLICIDRQRKRYREVAEVKDNP